MTDFDTPGVENLHVVIANSIMSTEWAREKTVEELNLQNLTDEEAIRRFELANEGVTTLRTCLNDGVPFSSRWNRNSEVRGTARIQTGSISEVLS